MTEFVRGGKSLPRGMRIAIYGDKGAIADTDNSCRAAFEFLRDDGRLTEFGDGFDVNFIGRGYAEFLQ